MLEVRVFPFSLIVGEDGAVLTLTAMGVEVTEFDPSFTVTV